MSIQHPCGDLVWLRASAAARALTWVVLVSLLAAPLGPVWAGELPVVGVATGEESRATVVEMLNTLSTFDYDLGGYQIVTPRQTARRIDDGATRQRQLLANPEYDAQVDDLIREGWENLERGDVPSALAILQTALEMVEYGQPARVRLGSQERWFQVRMLMAAAHLQNPAKQGGDILAAKAVIQPAAIFFPDRDPSADGFGPIMVKFFDESVRNLYLLPHGRLSVDTISGPYEVFVNGLSVGEAPVKEILLPIGDYSVEVGRADKTGRIHQVTIARGKTLSLTIDPLLENNLRTEGLALYEAEPGQDPATTALFVGLGVSKMVGSRYALVVGAPEEGQSAENKTIYVALVDAESGRVVRESTSTISSTSDEHAVANTLETTLTGRDRDAEAEEWPFARWAWIVSSVLSVSCFVVGGYYISDGVDNDQAAQETLVGSAEGDRLADEANTSFLIGGLAIFSGLVFAGIAAYYMYEDFKADESVYKGTVRRPDWQLVAAPTLDPHGQASGMNFGLWFQF